MSIAHDEIDDGYAPQLPTASIDIQPPPDVVESQGATNLLATVIPMMGSMGIMVFMAISNGNPASLMMGGGMVVAMLAMVGFNVYRQVGGHRAKVRDTRREYLAHLAETRETVRAAARQQRRYTRWNLPEPDALVLVAAQGSRVWTRTNGDPHALQVRIGSTSQTLSASLLEPQLPVLANPDPVCYSAMHRFVAVHSRVDDLAAGVDLGVLSHVELVGDIELARGQTRAMIAHLATFTAPSALLIAVMCPESLRPEWEWVKWLPQARSTEVNDALGPARMIVSDYADLADMLGSSVTDREGFRPRGQLTPWPHVLIVLDGMDLPTDTRLGSLEGTAGVTVLSLKESWGALVSRTTMRLQLHPAAEGARPSMDVVLVDQEPTVVSPDTMGVNQAEAVARRLTPWASGERRDTSEPIGRSDPTRSVDLMELLGVGDIRDFDPDRQWVRRTGRDRLRVPFAVTPEGIPVLIDLKESAQQGMGPHGLLIGATGSGKSEVLRTIVLALALTHSPEQLNLVLADFKGGATFAGMAALPHVSAMISNLEAELYLVDRMEDALRGEMVRRQELLRAAGNYANVTDYEADRLAGKHDFEPLPALFIILDEFSEMLDAKPNFISTFVQIGRLGRSLAIHLLLSSQRLDEGRLRGLESHLSYRVGLKTFSAQDSRAVLGVPDAADLPPAPGVGFLKTGSESMTRFRASYVAAPPPPRRASTRGQGRAGAPAQAIEVIPFTSTYRAGLTRSSSDADTATPTDSGPVVAPGDERWADMTELSIAVERMEGHGMPAHQVWLPPLDVPDTLDRLMPDLAVVPGLGLISMAWREQGAFVVPLGTADVPAEQRRETLTFDLSGAAGNLVVVGAPVSGKSMTVRSLVLALALTHTPAEVQFYVLDFGGGTFAPFEGATHVAGVATRDQSDVVNRTIAEIEALIDDREAFFRAHRVDSMANYRDRREQGELDDGYGDVFLVVDGWGTVRADFEDLMPRIQSIGTRGLGLGVHLVVTATRWNELPQALQEVFGSKFELRLATAGDSAIDRKLAESLPSTHPGFGLGQNKHHTLVGLPRIDGATDPDTVSAGVADAWSRIAQAWTGAPGPKLRLLPELVRLDDLRRANSRASGLLIGVEESRLGPLIIDPAEENHLYLYGDAKSGKTTFLRSLIHELTTIYTPDQAKIITIDLRRSLLGEIPQPYNFGYFTNREDVGSAMRELADMFTERLPGSDVTLEQLRAHSWWQGAEAWILVDDYDLVSTVSGNPLEALQPLLAQARDVGFHLVLARRAGGASRMAYDKIGQTLTELGTTGILLAGDPDEGPLIGKIKARRSAPGRAQVVSRDAGRTAAQLVWTNPVE